MNTESSCTPSRCKLVIVISAALVAVKVKIWPCEQFRGTTQTEDVRDGHYRLPWVLSRVISPINGNRYVKVVPVVLEGIDSADLRGSDGSKDR